MNRILVSSHAHIKRKLEKRWAVIGGRWAVVANRKMRRWSVPNYPTMHALPWMPLVHAPTTVH